MCFALVFALCTLAASINRASAATTMRNALVGFALCTLGASLSRASAASTMCFALVFALCTLGASIKRALAATTMRNALVGFALCTLGASINRASWPSTMLDALVRPASCIFGASLKRAFLRRLPFGFVSFLRGALTFDLLTVDLSVFLFLYFLLEQLGLQLFFALWPLSSNLIMRF
jgi:hypothetical protein